MSLVEVTQTDREEYIVMMEYGPWPKHAQAVREGIHDGDYRMQALARHRTDTLSEALQVVREARARLEAIANFGDPYEISEEPEEYGGTDDGMETVCMAYENMQSIAQAAHATLTAFISQHEGEAL